MNDYNEITIEALKFYRNSLRNNVWSQDTIEKIEKILNHLEK